MNILLNFTMNITIFYNFAGNLKGNQVFINSTNQDD